ncbi:MAG: MaoC family dehydratase N-terminal domain-containing protein [Proteobacteria bacterium]|nr:MaoC family dehydratase N-terminal domain-containing protein [Pseudomonadota bacterium]
MGLNLDLLGKKSDPVPYECNEDKLILYALGIGAGVEKELDFLYEKNLKVFPTFAVIPYFPAVGILMVNSGINMFATLHGEQHIKWFAPTPTRGTLLNTAVWTKVYDKGDSGAMLHMQVDTTDDKGNLIFQNNMVAVDRSAGNFGGDRGPKTAKLMPPEGKAPDFSVNYTTGPNQAALYRLSGDYNPLHIEPEFAAMGGFDRPILHGLCTLGYTGRAILHSVCGSDPARMKALSCRFTGVVFPGDTLTIEGWQLEPGKYTFQTKTQDGRVVLGNALAEVA